MTLPRPSVVIDAHDLTKRYGKAMGVDRLSFQVEAGEIFGYLGPNGAGKTTTIRLMLDLLRPSDGAIRLFGRPVKKASMEIRKRCGYLPGDFKPLETMSASRYLAFCAAVRGKDAPAPQSILMDRFHLTAKDLSKKTQAPLPRHPAKNRDHPGLFPPARIVDPR